MKNIVYSAPIPYIFTGEEGMLYGKPACAIAIDKDVIVRLQDKNQNELEGNDIELIGSVDAVVRKRLRVDSRKTYSAMFELAGELQVDGGLGVQSAKIVALAGALYELYSNEKGDENIVNQLSFEVDKRLDAQSSGLLTSTACFGGLVYYRKEFEFLKGLYRLNFKIPNDFLQYLCVIQKKDAQDIVAKAYRKDAQQTERILSKLEKHTKRLIVAIAKEDREFFKHNMKERLTLLSKLGLKCNKLPKHKQSVTGLRKL